jgi:hypothetical protein
MKKQNPPSAIPDIRPGQSIELLKELHILTRDGKLNQDSRRKLKQVYHLPSSSSRCSMVWNPWSIMAPASPTSASSSTISISRTRASGEVIGIESRPELVDKSRELAARLGFPRMRFLACTVEEALSSTELPPTVDVVTALHACNTATDDAIRFALSRQARHIVLVPCCQAEVAATMRARKAESLARRRRFRIVAAPDPHPRTGQPPDQCAALPAAGIPRLRRHRHRTGRLGTLDEERTDHRQQRGTPRRNARERAEAILREFNIEELAPRFTY